MTIRKICFSFLALLTALFAYICNCEPVAAQTTTSELGQEQTETRLKYIRQTLDENKEPLAMQTSITRFTSEDGETSVDLIGAVHIGSGSYYEVLNELFTDYDVVLYELVAPDENNIPQAGHRSSNPLSFLQNSAQQMLGLESQLAGIDYNKSNFVHADLSPSEMQQKMAERGQTGWSVALSAFSEMMNNPAAQQANADMTMSEMLDAFNSPYKLRRMMAAQFSSDDLEAGLGSTLNQMIVTDRNIEAMKVLSEQMAEGNKKIAIFYGAAHMPDFEARLMDEKFSFTSQAWVDAWDLRKSAAADSPMSPLMKMLEELSR